MFFFNLLTRPGSIIRQNKYLTLQALTAYWHESQPLFSTLWGKIIPIHLSNFTVVKKWPLGHSDVLSRGKCPTLPMATTRSHETASHTRALYNEKQSASIVPERLCESIRTGHGKHKKNRKKWKACSVLKGHKQPSLACFYVPALCACWNKTLIILQLSCIVLHSLNIFFTFFLSVNAALTPVLFAPITVALLSDGMVPVGKGLMQPAHFYFARSTKAHSIADRTDWSESTEFFF